MGCIVNIFPVTVRQEPRLLHLLHTWKAQSYNQQKHKAHSPRVLSGYFEDFFITSLRIQFDLMLLVVKQRTSTGKEIDVTLNWLSMKAHPDVM